MAELDSFKEVIIREYYCNETSFESVPWHSLAFFTVCLD